MSEDRIFIPVGYTIYVDFDLPKEIPQGEGEPSKWLHFYRKENSFHVSEQVLEQLKKLPKHPLNL